MRKDNRRNHWTIDWILFALFLVSFFVDLTGLALHEWLGAAAIGLAAYHLLAHRSWVGAVTRRFFTRTSLQARAFYVVDSGLLAGFLLIGASGLAISTWLNLPLADFNTWSHLHLMASIITLLLVVLKIALHWRWISVAARRYVIEPIRSLSNPPRSASIPERVERRDFLKLMGIVGAAAVVAVHGVLDDAQATGLGGVLFNTVELDPQSPASSPSQAAEPTAAASTPHTIDATPVSGDTDASVQCVIRCPNGCFYPGGCRRYRDGNENGRCDLGECA